MRALILVAGAALAVSACSSNESADDTMNVDTIEANTILETNDMTALDATSNLDANLATDMNMTDMNMTDMNATDLNATDNAM